MGSVMSKGKGVSLNPDELEQTGSHVGGFGDRVAEHTSKLGTTNQSLSAHVRSDKSGLGKVFSKFVDKTSTAFSDMGKELSRVVKGAGTRLKTTGRTTRKNESDVTQSMKGIKPNEAGGSSKPASETPTKPSSSNENTNKPSSSAPPGKDKPNSEKPESPQGPGQGHNDETQTSSASPKDDKPKSETPDPETQSKINDHQQKADNHKQDANDDFFTDEEKNRFGKAQGYHQNAADNYKNGNHEQAHNNATAAGHQEHAIKVHDDAMESGGKQKQHQQQAAGHYEQAAEHSANGQHDAANAHASAGSHHEQAANHVGKKQYGPADRQQVAARHDSQAADQHSEADKLSPDDPAAQDHRTSAGHHQQAAGDFANNRPQQGHASAAQANQHAANGYQKQGNNELAQHHQGLANNHQNASDHLGQADQHHEQADTAQKQKDDAARLQHQREEWKQQQLAAHQNGIAHNTHQQLVSHNAGDTAQANHHQQAVEHHQQQQQQLENYHPPAAPTHTPTDPHTADHVPYQAPANQPHVYRWDDRRPEQAFSEGMKPQESSTDHSLYTHTLGGTSTHYVSTSGDPAFQWPKQNRYVMNPPAGTHDANATLGTHSPYPHQQEATAPGTIPGDHIIAAENPTTGEVEFPSRGGRL